MKKNLEVGLEYTYEKTVTSADTAAALGSGGIEVFSTPMMIALMEGAALKCVEDALESGLSTVGIHLDVKHLAATPDGMKVKATAKLIEIDRKKLKFEIVAYDEMVKIGEGVHSRYIIESEPFLKACEEKKNAIA